jgi:DNA polymerase-4
LIVVPPSHGIYGEKSAEVFAVFRSFTPHVEGLSLDEAFLDVRGLRLHYGAPGDVAAAIRARLRHELSLPASVGIAAVKFVAKLASQAAKPDGVLQVTEAEQGEFLRALPASAMWGVGPATLAALERLGVETVGDIADLPVESLAAAIGPSGGQHLHDLANGLDPRPVVPDSAAKSISVEETYENDLSTADLVEAALLAHAQRLSWRLRRAGVRGRTVTLKVRFADFETMTRSHTAAGPVDGSRQLFRMSVDLLGSLGAIRPVRLLGLSATSLELADLPTQLDIETDLHWESVEDAIADVRVKFGESSVGPARLIPSQKSSIEPEEL